MESAEDGSLVMPQSTGDKARVGGLVAGVCVLLFVVMQLLGFNPVISLVLVLLCTVRLWWRAYVLFTSPPPALTPDGVRLRIGRSDSTIPWSEIISLGLVKVNRVPRTYLEVMASNAMKYPGRARDGVNFIYLSPSVVSPEQVRDAVARLTHGQLVVRDEPQRSTLAS
jgi:hypothetical protein